jgi:hypothetical protein
VYLSDAKFKIPPSRAPFLSLRHLGVEDFERNIDNIEGQPGHRAARKLPFVIVMCPTIKHGALSLLTPKHVIMSNPVLR